MPRRNRKKVHRAQRLAAETRRAERTEARRRAHDQARVAEAAIARALARRDLALPSLPAPAAAALTTVRELCGLASMPAAVTARVEGLLRVLAEQAPELAVSERLPWFLLLARQPWQRPLGQWRAPGGSTRRKADALVAHLLARFPVPPFLLRALDLDLVAIARVPEEDEWAVRVLAWVGAGRSLAKAPPEVLPTPLTRRTVHAFLGATARTAPIRALRRAQLAAHGAPAGTVRAVLQTRLAVLRGPDPGVGEPFWDTILAWYAARPGLYELDGPALERVFAWVEAEQRLALADGRHLVLKGRPLDAVRRQVEAWHAARRPPSGAFPPSGLAPWAEGPWTLTELVTPQALRQEGTAMAHCVGAYVGLARKRRVSLWSMRLDGQRHATVEVALPTARIVQAKRKANQPIEAEARAVLRRFARASKLTLAC